MKKLFFILAFFMFFSLAFAEQSLQEKLGICQNHDYVQLEMANGKKVILYKARIHRAQLIGTPVSYDNQKKKYVNGKGNSPSYYANRIKKVSAFDVNQKPKK